MKKLIVSCIAIAAFAPVFAVDDVAVADEKGEETVAVEEAEDTGAPLFWGFGNYGIYSGYQLYGALLNSEPTLQGYIEANVNIPANLGYVGVGLWSNTDLTDKRRDLYGKAFNEWDPNVHYGKTFWFDDEEKWGLAYRTSVVWYYYPHHRGHDHNTHGKDHFQFGRKTMTTMDWNHSFELVNPYVIPFVNWVHEYHENKANLWEMGAKKPLAVCENLTLVPSMTWTYRSHRYNWCFPTAGWTETHGSGFASVKLGLDANYRLTDHIGVFAKIYYCHIYDKSLRAAAEHGSGGDYSQYKDFAWGGVGLTFNF